jgi:hypothetical protein
MTLLNCYRYLMYWAADTTCVYEASESTLVDAFQRYSDPSLFSIARLQRLRLGLGRVCLRYDLSQPGEGISILGGKHLRWRIKDEKLSGKKRRVLSLDLPTGAEKMVEVLLAEHYSCIADHTVGDDQSTPYETYIVHDIQGGWLRKGGTHRPTAFMFWVGSQTPERCELPQNPLLGVRIYVPRLRIKLPFILPDINLDDLREVELPQAMLEMSYLQGRSYPAWLETDSEFGFTEWKGYGEVPAAIRERFPDR